MKQIEPILIWIQTFKYKKTTTLTSNFFLTVYPFKRLRSSWSLLSSGLKDHTLNDAKGASFKLEKR